MNRVDGHDTTGVDTTGDGTITAADYVAIVRSRYRVVVAVTVLVVALVAAWTASLTPAYLGRAAVAMVLPVSDQSRFVTRQQEYVDGVVRACIALSTRPAVLAGAIADAEVDRDIAELARATEARALADTLVIQVRVNDRSPAVAARLADAVAGNLTAACDELRPAGSTSDQPFRFGVTQLASVPDRDVWPRWRLSIGIAAVLGAVAGVGVAIGLDDLRPRVDGPRRPAGTRPLPLLGRLPRRGDTRRRSQLVARFESARRVLDADVVLVVPAGPGDAPDAVGALGTALTESGRRVRVLDPADPVHTVDGLARPGEDHDVVLLSAPGVLESPRCLELSARVDTVVLTASGRTPTRTVREAADVLERAGVDVLGLIRVD